MRSLLAIGILIVLLILGKLFFFNKKSEAANQAGLGQTAKSISKSMPVDVFVAEVSKVSTEVYASGSMVPNEEVELKSETSGRIVRLNIREGGFVSKGQLIAKINDSELQAALKRVNYEEELANQIEARQKRLLDINAISKEEYEIAVNKINTLSTDKEALKVQIEKTEVRAPFSGILGLKEISVGAYVTPGTPIANLVQTNPMKLDFSIPEKYSNKIKSGQKISFGIDGDVSLYDADILAVDSKIDDALRTLKVRAQTNNSKNRFLPGMFVKVTLPISQSNAIMIPSEAVVPVLSGKIVYKLKNGKAVESPITTGLRNEKNVEVIEGISTGDSIIVSALINLKPDQDVILKNRINQ